MVILTLGQYIFSDLGLSPKGRGECATYSPAELASSVVSGKVDEKIRENKEHLVPRPFTSNNNGWKYLMFVRLLLHFLKQDKIESQFRQNILGTSWEPNSHVSYLIFAEKIRKWCARSKTRRKIQKIVSVRTARERNSMLKPWLVDAVALCWSSY